MPPTQPAAQAADTERLQNRWARLLVPSLPDMFFLVCLGSLLLSSRDPGEQLLSDADVGWHIRTGEYILDHLSVPRHDLYSFTKPGEPWYAWEWLSEVALAAVHRAAGLKGVVLSAAVVIALFLTTVVRRMIARGVHLWLAVAITLLVGGSAELHYHARPHLLTLLFVSVALRLIEDDRARPSRRIYWLVPLTVLFTNLHGGFSALVVTLGLQTLGLCAEGLCAAPRDLRPALRAAKLTAACALASLANPYGWALHVHIAQYVRSSWIRDTVHEFASPSFRSTATLHFEWLLGASLIVAGAALRKRRFVEPLWIIAWGHMALVSARHIPVFAAICAPSIASQLSDWLRAWLDTRRSGIAARLDTLADRWLSVCHHTSLAPWLAVFALATLELPVRWPQDFPARYFPTQLVHEHAELLAHARVFTTDQWADYMLYSDPRSKVFIDGRSDFYGETVGTHYLEMLRGHWRWRKWLDHYAIDAVLLPVSSALTELLKTEPSWRQLRDDGEHALFVRRSAEPGARAQ